MANKIQLRRDTSTNWTTVNPILTDGEPGLEIDTLRIKYGNGTLPWSCLSYAGSEANTGDINFSATTISGPQCTSYCAGPAHGNIQIIPNSWIGYTNNGQYLNIYPTNNTDSPHIHIAAGSGSCRSGDLILGDDNKNVSIINDGNIQINSYAGSTQNRWVFDNTGNLTLPTGAQITKVYGETTLLDPNGAAIAANVGNAIAVSSEYGVGLYSNNHTWSFNSTGNLILPETNNITAAVTPQTGTLINGIETYTGTGACNTYVWLPPDSTFHILYGIGSSIVGWSMYPTCNPTNVVEIVSYAPIGSCTLGFSGPLPYGTTYAAHSPCYATAHPNPVNVEANSFTWSFGITGNLTLPEGGTINYYNGCNALNGVSVTWSSLDNKNNACGPVTIALGKCSGAINQGYGAISIGCNAGHENQGSNGCYPIAIGAGAGYNCQHGYSIAIGANSGYETQSGCAIAIGRNAGHGIISTQIFKSYCGARITLGNNNCVTAGMYVVGCGFNGTQQVVSVGSCNCVVLSAPPCSSPNACEVLTFNGTQNEYAIAVGTYAGCSGQGLNSIAVGFGAGAVYQNSYSVTIGYEAGIYFQGTSAIAIGNGAGSCNQGAGSIAIGAASGIRHQLCCAVAIGTCSGNLCQGGYAVALGTYTGTCQQGYASVAIGVGSGFNDQGGQSIAVGACAGVCTQGYCSVAIGTEAGTSHQGHNAVAIGAFAGRCNQPNYSIMINASCTSLNGTESGFYVNPVRNDTGNVFVATYYNTSTNEITYAPTGGIVNQYQQVTITTASCQQGPGGHGSVTYCVSAVAPISATGILFTVCGAGNHHQAGTTSTGLQTVSWCGIGAGVTPYVAYAYVTTTAGTVYSAPAFGKTGLCLLEGTLIALSDGTYKKIEDIAPDDLLLVWDFDRGCYTESTPLWIKRAEVANSYNLLTFSDGSTLGTIDQHRIFNKEKGAFTYPMTDDTPIGTTTVNQYGVEVALVSKEVVHKTAYYYNVITDYHVNLYANGILTSNRFNNIYPICNMKFVKDNRIPRNRSEFIGVPERFYTGLRLAEQTYSAEMIAWYVNRLVALENNKQLVLI